MIFLASRYPTGVAIVVSRAVDVVVVVVVVGTPLTPVFLCW